jgi:exoribonuclease R
MSTNATNATILLENVLNVSQVDAPPEIHGILQTKNYTDFMILSDTGDLLHTFTGSANANKCLPGDHVSLKEGKCHLELRTEHPLIVGTLELTSISTYGLTKRGYPLYLFTPYHPSYPHFIVGCSEKDRSKNKIVLIKFDQWSATFPRGLLERTLGNSGEYAAEYTALIWQASPYVYPAYHYQPVRTQDASPRIIDGFTFNIDPEGCHDVDDVFTFEKKDNGWLVTITISDVAGYVEDGSAIDIMASLIGQTLYDENGTILRAMLPAAYENACSLLPGKKSHGISMQFLFRNQVKGSSPMLSSQNSMERITDITWFESVLENNKTYTYEQFQQNPYGPLQEIASYLAKEPLGDSHSWVEQMMIYYNKTAGEMLKHAQMGILRRHSAPNRQKLEAYRQHLPEFEKFAYHSAEYCLAEEDDTRHYGLGSSAYTHASSPIRRYADLVNQRVLKQLIRKSGEKYIVPITMYDMKMREKAIKHFARDADFLKAITSGTTFTGIIMDTIQKGNAMKLRIYVPAWKRMISTRYTRIDEKTVLSRDEKKEIDVRLYRTVQLSCAVLLQARNWKERVIVHVS